MNHLSQSFIFTFQEDIEPYDPLISGDVSVIVGVKIFEDPVHQYVICHVETAVEELTEQLPVHPVYFG